jgi:hypothetical protein
MRDRHIREKTRERPPEGARSIPLHYEKFGWTAQRWKQGGDDLADVRMRVGFTRAAQVLRPKFLQPEIRRIESRMLARKDERRRKPPRGERVGDGCKLDGFGPGADDQTNISGTQPSP